MRRLLPRAALLAALLAGPTTAFGAEVAPGARHLPAAPEPAALLPRYLLRDPQGRAVTIDDFRGRFQLVTFGFVSCPDVCPTTLLEFKQVLALLGDEAKRLQPIFITIDPERDTRDILREYTAAFDARILGLTGSPDLVRRAADSFRIEYEKVREPGAKPENYTMNHTAGMVLLDTNGRFLARYAYAMPAAEIAQRIRQAMAVEGR
ncbi:MAG: SCO family protein [Betaproteobacteria bacterium]|nr:SCO family protein [Betaproteobacteria bacterium]